MSDHNANAQVQERMLGFVAASRFYGEHNAAVVTEVRLENTTLKEKIRQLEEARQSAPPPQRRAPSQAPRAPKQQTAPQQTQQQSTGSLYGRWIDDSVGSTRALEPSKLTPGQASIANCLNTMFQSQWEPTASLAQAK